MLGSLFGRLSLKQKLPLLICGLLLGVVLLYSGASYRSVKSASLAVGRERLRSVTDQTADLLDASVANTQKTMRSLAGDSAVVGFLRAPTAASRAAALAAIRRPGPNNGQRIAVELWDARKRFIVSSVAGGGAPGGDARRAVELAAAGTPHGDVSRELALASTSASRVAIGRIRAEGDTAVVAIASAVLDAGKPVGYYVEWRRISSTAQARDQFLRLVGTNAALLIGNDSGGVYTDLAAVARAPAADTRFAKDIVAYSRSDGTRVFARSRAIAGTPWYVVIEIPQDAVLAAADEFMRRSAIIGLVLVALGLLAAWLMSRTITEPLRRLTEASSAMAAGDLAQAVDVARSDELGQLGAAFNTMAAQVRDTTATLEARVKERTERLEQLQAVMLRTERLNTLATLGAGLAHDLNNLLFSIGLSIEELQRDNAAGRVTRAGVLAEINRASTEARRLTQRLMVFARSAQGGDEPRPIEVNAAVAAQEDLLRMLLPRTIGLRMQLEAPKRRVMLPESLIEQALVNLVSNARDAMPSGGDVTVRVREERADRSRRLLLEVTDTGHGIAPEIQESIFDTFFSTKADKGTGIGLASVRALMTSVGGSVTVNSQPGKGATFSLAFPLDAAS